MKFHLVQTHLAWEDAAANREALSRKIDAIEAGPAVVILPEMFSTGFSMASSRLAESMQGATVAWLQDKAADTGKTICGSMIVEAGGRFFNRFIWTTPDRQIAFYDKRHLFRMADEHDHYSPGSSRLQLQAGDLRLMPQVCYDLRFPAWSRNGFDGEPYDVLLYVANWPAPRRDQWLALLRARAIENLCYVIGVNRIGQDGNAVSYAGDSCVFGPTGEMLLDLKDRDETGSIDLSREPLDRYREDFPAYLDADRLRID